MAYGTSKIILIMRTFFTVDIEQDCPPFRSTFGGIEQGLPKLSAILKQKKIVATFFVTGDIARRYPATIREIANAGHEIGCHGDTHARFDQINYKQAQTEIRQATETLRTIYPVVSFRAPNLQMPEQYLEILSEYGYQIDSSGARHKRPWLKPQYTCGIVRIPVSTTSLVLRLSPPFRNFFLRQMKDPVVLFVHPWEFIDLQNEKLRFDCRWRTGEFSLNAIAETIDFFQKKGASFQTLNSMLSEEEATPFSKHISTTFPQSGKS